MVKHFAEIAKAARTCQARDSTAQNRVCGRVDGREAHLPPTWEERLARKIYSLPKIERHSDRMASSCWCLAEQEPVEVQEELKARKEAMLTV